MGGPWDPWGPVPHLVAGISAEGKAHLIAGIFEWVNGMKNKTGFSDFNLLFV